MFEVRCSSAKSKNNSGLVYFTILGKLCMHHHHPCHQLTMVFATAIVDATRAFASANRLLTHLTTIPYLSFNLFLLWHYLYPLFLCRIIATALPSIGLERCNFYDHPIVLPALLTLADGVEAGLSKEPWVGPIRQVLLKIVVAIHSGRAAILVDHLSCLVPFAFTVCLLLDNFCTYKMAYTKPPEENLFT